MFWLARRNELPHKDGRPCVHDSYDHGLFAHCFQKLWFTIASPLFHICWDQNLYGLPFFRLQVMSCHGEESEDEGMSTADELAKTAVAIGSPKIDVSMLRHVFTTK
jgi:hypothetical protein